MARIRVPRVDNQEVKKVKLFVLLVALMCATVGMMGTALAKDVNIVQVNKANVCEGDNIYITQINTVNMCKGGDCGNGNGNGGYIAADGGDYVAFRLGDDHDGWLVHNTLLDGPKPQIGLAALIGESNQMVVAIYNIGGAAYPIGGSAVTVNGIGSFTVPEGIVLPAMENKKPGLWAKVISNITANYELVRGEEIAGRQVIDHEYYGGRNLIRTILGDWIPAGDVKIADILANQRYT